MKIPNKIKIGGHIYKIIFQKTTDLANNDCGKTDRTKGIITIDADLIQSEKEETFFHEVEVDFLAQAFYYVLKNNNLLK
ncbi:MAG: hypothetical protein AABY22_12285 [Nanoarchaeota archaeon]